MFNNKQAKKDGAAGGKSYIYREKQTAEGADSTKNGQLLGLPEEDKSTESKQRGMNKMANLLSGLKADDSD